MKSIWYAISRSQGAAVFGRGAYASPNRVTAASYAGDQGMIFELPIKNDPRLRILDWPQVENNPIMQEIVAKAYAQGQDPFGMLARDFGIDIMTPWKSTPRRA